MSRRGTHRAFWIGLLSAAVVLSAAQVCPADGQVSGLKARHRAGQTFLTWKEVDPPEATDDTKASALRGLVYQAAAKREVQYRIYRSERPIASVAGLKAVAEAPPLTCWNVHFYGIYPDKRRREGEKNLRFVVKDGGEPVEPGMGIYVHQPKLAEGTSAKAYYAVTLVRGGKENPAVSAANSLAAPVEERAGEGLPVLQRVIRGVKFNYVDDTTLHYYVRWEAPPRASVESSPFNYLVAVPPNAKAPSPVGIHFHCWGNHLRGGYGHWANAGKGAILIAPNQVPYDWWTGYHESVRPTFHQPMPRPKEKDEWNRGVVRPYTQNRILAFFEWACTKWEIDRKRTFTAGNSMGGAGSLMFAIRHGDKVAWCRSQVGVHVPAHSPHFRGSYERVWGRLSFDVKFEDGHSVWNHFSDDWYLRKYPRRDVGYLIFANGKNDLGIGWKQAVEFYRALQDTRRPHLFVWQMRGHGSSPFYPNPTGARRVRSMPIDVRTDQSLPAFTRCSLDDDPGTGTRLAEPKPWKKNPRGKMLVDKFDGEPEGQVNGYLYWETADVVDLPDRWEMTVGVTPTAPKDECTVDITPRRLQKLKVKPHQAFAWTAVRKPRLAGAVAGEDQTQAGTATADKWGLVTLKGVKVVRGGTRVTLRAAAK